MARVERHDLAVLGSVTQREVVRSHRVVFGANAEQLGLDAILHVGVLGGEYLVERLLQQLAILQAVDRLVLRAVVYPDVENRRIALTAAHLLGNRAATFGVLDPELADAFVGIGQSEHEVELKSSFMPFSAAHCIQLSKCSGVSSSRSTGPVARKSA